MWRKCPRDGYGSYHGVSTAGAIAGRDQRSACPARGGSPIRRERAAAVDLRDRVNLDHSKHAQIQLGLELSDAYPAPVRRRNWKTHWPHRPLWAAEHETAMLVRGRPGKPPRTRSRLAAGASSPTLLLAAMSTGEADRQFAHYPTVSRSVSKAPIVRHPSISMTSKAMLRVR
jgi:hypothetical protein